jgi:ribose transport system ATP-binding protein
MPAPLLATRNLTRDFPGVRALDNVDFELAEGEVHVLFGENGAGKSTLINILSGALRPSSGRIEFRGQPIEFASVHDARACGISAVFQEFSLVPQMTVEENLFLGAEPRRGPFLDRAAMRAEALSHLEELGFDIEPSRRVDHLSRAEQQMVEIAKAFRSELSVLILDEPTASLTDHESERLFSLIETLKRRGVGIIYITHRLAEIWRVGDRITVLRDGRKVATVDPSSVTEDDLVRLMTGREGGEIFPPLPGAHAGEEILRLEDVSARAGMLRDVSLNVHRGEIVGLAGLVGSGKSEAMQAAFGAVTPSTGRILYRGEEVTGNSPRSSIRAGFLYLPADRREEGLMLVRPVRENISLAALDVPPVRRGPLLDRVGERRMVGELVDRLSIAPRRPEMRVEHLSGGNQQKVMLARSLTRRFELLVFDEPTVGVDMGARAAIYAFIAELAAAGMAIVLVSSDLPEILHLSHRVYVFYRGRVQAELQRNELSEEAVLAHFFERESA